MDNSRDAQGHWPVRLFFFPSFAMGKEEEREQERRQGVAASVKSRW